MAAILLRSISFVDACQQLIAKQDTYRLVRAYIESKRWSTYYVFEIELRAVIDSSGHVEILKKLEPLTRIATIERLVTPVRKPESLKLPVFVSQRKEDSMDIRKYSLTLGPVGTEQGDDIESGELLIESTDGLSPTLADVDLPTEIVLDLSASVVEFEVIEDRVYTLRSRYIDNDGKVGISDPLEFTSVDDTGPSVPPLQAPVFLEQRTIPDSPPAQQ